MLKSSFRRHISELRSLALCLFVSMLSMLATSCRMDMQDQPKAKPYRSSTFFNDGSAMRRPPEGTVARGFLQENSQLFLGKMPAAASASPGGTTGATPGAANQPADVTDFPFPITQEVMVRGKGRYEIYCSVCHGTTGHGDGMVIRRGFNRKPPAFSDARLLTSPVGHYFDVISNGWGAMPSYSQQIPVNDRWAIIAYLRALQRSQTGGAVPATTTPAAGNSNSNSGGNSSTAQPGGNRAQNRAGGQR